MQFINSMLLKVLLWHVCAYMQIFIRGEEFACCSFLIYSRAYTSAKVSLVFFRSSSTRLSSCIPLSSKHIHWLMLDLSAEIRRYLIKDDILVFSVGISIY